MGTFFKIMMVAAGLLCVGGLAYGQSARPEEAVKYRQAVMTLISQHLKTLGTQIQGRGEPQKDQIAREARVLAFLAELPWEAMTVPGSDRGNTTLNPTVFSRREQFEQEFKSFEAAAQMLATTADSGDPARIRDQFAIVAGSCKKCHDQFRKR